MLSIGSRWGTIDCFFVSFWKGVPVSLMGAPRWVLKTHMDIC